MERLESSARVCEAAAERFNLKNDDDMYDMLGKLRQTRQEEEKRQLLLRKLKSGILKLLRKMALSCCACAVLVYARSSD